MARAGGASTSTGALCVTERHARDATSPAASAAAERWRELGSGNGGGLAGCWQRVRQSAGGVALRNLPPPKEAFILAGAAPVRVSSIGAKGKRRSAIGSSALGAGSPELTSR